MTVLQCQIVNSMKCYSVICNTGYRWHCVRSCEEAPKMMDGLRKCKRLQASVLFKHVKTQAVASVWVEIQSRQQAAEQRRPTSTMLGLLTITETLGMYYGSGTVKQSNSSSCKPVTPLSGRPADAAHMQRRKYRAPSWKYHIVAKLRLPSIDVYLLEE